MKETKYLYNTKDIWKMTNIYCRYGMVMFTKHAKEMMEMRRITADQILHVMTNKNGESYVVKRQRFQKKNHNADRFLVCGKIKIRKEVKKIHVVFTVFRNREGYVSHILVITAFVPERQKHVSWCVKESCDAEYQISCMGQIHHFNHSFQWLKGL